MVRRLSWTLAELVLMTMPGDTFCTQDLTRLLAPSTSTTQTPQEALVETSGR
jgi:hypothetical protein